MSSLIAQMHSLAKDQNIEVGQIFEEVVKVAYQNIISAGDHVIDVGAHDGFHTNPMAKAVGRKGKVYAFEPIPYLLRNLKKQIKKNRLSNVELYKKALGMQDQKSRFQHFQKFPGYSGLRRRITPFNDQEGLLKEITVKQTRLDTVFPSTTEVSFIKLDIEGGELHALMGGIRLIKRSRPVIIFEFGCQETVDTYNFTKEDSFAYFESRDFSVYPLAGDLFTQDKWGNQEPCWEMVALPNEKKALSAQFPIYCHQVLQ